MKFTKETFTNLTGENHHMFYHADADSLEPFTITASRAGVKFHGGLMLEAQEDLNTLAKVLSEAWKLHRQLQPKLTTTLSGH